MKKKYTNFRSDPKSEEAHFSKYPQFENAEYSRTYFGKTKVYPARPGCDIAELRQIFLQRLQQWSLKIPKKYLKFPEQIREILASLDVLQLVKFILSFCSYEVCEQAVNESPILHFIGHLRDGFLFSQFSFFQIFQPF